MAQDYLVGHRKPPKQTQFKKGQSGNPSGKPGPAKTLRARLRQALAESLEKPMIELRLDTDNSLEDVIRKVIRMSNAGDVPSTRLLFALVEKFEPKEVSKASEDISGTPSSGQAESGDDSEKSGKAANGTQSEDKSGTNSLPQGESQGDFSKEPPRSEETVSEQAVEPLVVPPAGRIEGTAHKIEDVVAPRPKQMTIMVAGKIVQQGD